MPEARDMLPELNVSLIEPSDAELATRVAGRDRAAFEQMYDRYAGKALGMCIRILGDRWVGEDVLQESFWRVWQKADSFNSVRGSFATWLFSTVHHCAIDEMRRLRSRGGVGLTVELDADNGEASKIPDPQANVMQTVMASIQNDHVQTALAQLPEAQRAIITLAYYGGYTRQEIAVRLGEPLGTVHTRARLGLSKLRDLLAEAKT